MNIKDITDLTADQLKDYISTHDERDYVMIDVRQPEEYYESHIPGSKLIPFPTMGTNIESLPHKVDIIFTCRSGARSRAAAALTFGTSKDLGRIYNLKGGILAWNGKTIQDFPKVQVLGKKNDVEDMLMSAMDLEKGAWNFYKSILEKFPKEPFSDAIEYLSLAESDHAEALYRILVTKKNDLPEFDTFFHSMKGDILEGGVELKDALKRLDTVKTAQPLAILDMALDIEYSAFDLYRSGADIVTDPDIKRILYGIANGEKQHMKKLATAFSYLK
ncbi:MAG: ferritin-like domain-containing protein [Proteobacteria bacterium]|nr:ferritin-like domain-containing protein [Pseudomonadota bacterium]